MRAVLTVVTTLSELAVATTACCVGLLDEVVQVTGADAIAHAKDMATREVSSLLK
jgi:hypothetical protein